MSTCRKILLSAMLLAAVVTNAAAQGVPNRSGVRVQGDGGYVVIPGSSGYTSAQQFRRDWNVQSPDGQTTVLTPRGGSYPPGRRPRNIYIR